MPKMIWIFIALAIAMWLLQGLLSVLQLKKFNRELKQLRKTGRVAIGKTRGRFKSGCLLLLCIDENAVIIKGRKLQGITSFASFRDFNELNGIKLTDVDGDVTAGFDAQTAKAIASAVDEYVQYSKQQQQEIENKKDNENNSENNTETETYAGSPK